MAGRASVHQCTLLLSSSLLSPCGEWYRRKWYRRISRSITALVDDDKFSMHECSMYAIQNSNFFLTPGLC